MNNVYYKPDNQMNNLHIRFEVDKEPVDFDIITNVSEKGMPVVLDNWFARTNEYTRESLVKYINSKSHYGFKAK